MQRGNKNRELDELRKQYIQEKGYSVIEMYECDWRNMYKTDNIVKQHMHKSFPLQSASQRSKTFREYQIWKSIWFQCEFEVPKKLREVFANLPPIHRNIIVGRDDIGPFIKENAEKEGYLTQPRRMLKSSYFLENRKMVTPLLLFYLDLGLVCRK